MSKNNPDRIDTGGLEEIQVGEPVSNNSSVELEAEERELRLDAEKSSLQDFKNFIDLRSKLSKWILIAALCWLIAVLIVLVSSGLGWLTLSSSVLSVLLGATSLKVLGLVYIVANYAFGRGLYGGGDE